MLVTDFLPEAVGAEVTFGDAIQAEQGDAQAQFKLGLMHYNGDGWPQDFKQAFAWFSARRPSKVMLMRNSLIGCTATAGVPKMLPKRWPSWYRKAAEQGDAQAQFNLGVAYDNGEGVPQDVQRAAAWTRKAAEQGHANAQYNLGVSYENTAKACQRRSPSSGLYRKAAEQGNTLAQYNLGVIYSNGQGVPQDAAQGITWYRKAAEQRGCRCAILLGRDVPQRRRRASGRCEGNGLDSQGRLSGGTQPRKTI